jgi:hypothetical protein
MILEGGAERIIVSEVTTENRYGAIISIEILKIAVRHRKSFSFNGKSLETQIDRYLYFDNWQMGLNVNSGSLN